MKKEDNISINRNFVKNICNIESIDLELYDIEFNFQSSQLDVTSLMTKKYVQDKREIESITIRRKDK